MLKIFDLLAFTRAGRFAARAYALALLLVIVVCGGMMEAHDIVFQLGIALLSLTITYLKEISVHRGSIADRACNLLPLARGAVDLVFALLTLPVRFYAAPSRQRPRLPAGRLGRLPAVTLSPRLLPVPTASA